MRIYPPRVKTICACGCGKIKYITGRFNSEGRFVPMGWSKDLETAKKCADLHDQIICELRIVEWKKSH